MEGSSFKSCNGAVVLGPEISVIPYNCRGSVSILSIEKCWPVVSFGKIPDEMGIY
jgi:hypothetical protein